jgi:hypothetical protein
MYELIKPNLMLGIEMYFCDLGLDLVNSAFTVGNKESRIRLSQVVKWKDLIRGNSR